MKPTTFRKGNHEISIYNKLTDDLTAGLDKYLTGNLQTAYFKLLEETVKKDLTFRYVLVRDGDQKILAFLYFQLLKFSDNNLSLKGNYIVRLLTKIFLRLRPFKILISGNLFAVNFPVIKYDNTALSSSEIIDLIFEGEKLYRPDVLMIKDLDETFSYSEMLSRGFEKYESDLTMSLKINKEWKNLEDYFNSLKKKYRKRAFNIRSSGSELVRKELNADEIHKHSSRIWELFQNVSDRQPVRMGQIVPEYFHEYKKRFPDVFSFTGFFYKDKLVSFVTYIDHKEILEVHFIGIDYSINTTMMLYFNLLIDALERGIKLGKDELELGRTARDAKASLGAEPVYFNDYIRYNSWTALFLSGIISRQFQKRMGENWAFRSPFADQKK